VTDRAAMFSGPGAAAYDRFVGRYSPQLAAALCDAAGIESGQRGLDVGCGSGALAAELARRLGEENVTGIDPSEPFVEGARRRVPGARIVDEFDATLSQLVVNFLGDPERGLREMVRVTRRGGVLAGCVWDYRGGMTMLRTFWDAATALDSDAADEGASMRFATPDELRELWARAGLAQVGVTPLVVEASYEDFNDLWQPFTTGIGPAGAYTVSLDPERQAALRAEFARRLGSPEGPFTLPARSWSAVGSVP
jgi:SAM-dependent methyltransferase